MEVRRQKEATIDIVIHNKTYWVVATEAAVKAGQRKANRDIRSRT